MSGAKTVSAVGIPTLHRFEDVAKSYGIEVRALKDQVRALRAERVRLGTKWYFTPAQLAAFHAASTVSSGARPGVDPLQKVRDRLANRARSATARRGAAGRSGR
ncbi:hypothetical protein [Actinoplanes sp. NPDC049118]|uniref:hypothetical protein n=1 Tax=Actinoplanes sp. NPDC049118 TaxID=3155769 RepID=UPI0033C50CDD